MKSDAFEDRLAEGNPRSLGRTEEVVLVVLRRPDRLAELFECLFNGDEIIRMRAGDALEKVCRDRPELFQSYIPRLLNEVSQIDQPSVQWHLAQMLAEVTLNAKERSHAVRLLKRNLSQSKDWIVITCTMDSLAHFAQDDVRLRRWFIGELRGYQGSEYKSIATRARKLLARLTVNSSF